MDLKGTITALVTPFLNQEVDAEGLINIIQYQVSQNINGILVLGSTGESSTLDAEEQRNIISIAVRETNGKIPLWVGTGTYCTKQTIEKTKQAQKLGADVALIVTPYYNKPSQEGIYRHFEEIAKEVEIPIVVYNIQGRCGVNIETSTLLRIAGLPNVIGVKEASGNVIQTGEVIEAIASKYPDFLVFSGDDILTLPMLALGASGVISVASNLIPDQVIALVNAALKGDFQEARERHYQLLPFFKSIFLETNPMPIKTAMNLCGMPSGECRLPLTQMSLENIQRLEKLLLKMQLIEETTVTRVD